MQLVDFGYGGIGRAGGVCHGVDNFVWPTALLLLVISGVATPMPFVPSGKRAIAASPYKRSFAIGYFFVALNTGIGICAIVLITFRVASGIKQSA
jgi:hypothetical protein